jgi:hypothetical protein
VGGHSSQDKSNGNGQWLIKFCSAITDDDRWNTILYKSIHKGTWRSSDGRIVNHTENVLIDHRHCTNLLDVRSLR